MLIILKHNATTDDIQAVLRTARELGCTSCPIVEKHRHAIGLAGFGDVNGYRLESLQGVLKVVRFSHTYEQVSREWREEQTVVELPAGTRIGGRRIAVVAGLSLTGSERQTVRTARRLREAGASLLRGSVFRPGASPYSPERPSEARLKLLVRAGAETGTPVVAEAVDSYSLERVAEHADMVQIGARNMQNFSLLRQAGRAGKPVLLERGMAATVQDLLCSAEYLLAEGNDEVTLCERGVCGFGLQTAVLDLTVVPVVKSLSHLPILVAPRAGPRTQVLAMTCAAVAAGADGLVIAFPPRSAESRSRQHGAPLRPRGFDALLRQVAKVAAAVGRRL
jgi:3-deoxy-7-phosphoheptulonate synthase